MLRNNKTLQLFGSLILTLIVAGCSSQAVLPEQISQSNGNELLIVDCLLPGQVRQLGQGLTYMTQRRPTKTTRVDCEIRGGEYVAYDRADYKTALSIWLPQAKKGDAEAQNYVGEIYEKGYGLPSDYKMAAKWYQKAAEQNYSRAQINLGYLYEKGLGVEKDLVTALNWYRKASGLEDDDLAFASTIETNVKAQYQGELDLLKNELNSRQAEIDKLQSQLNYSRKSFYRERRKLAQLKSKMGKTNQQLEKIKQATASPASNHKVNEYQRQLQTDKLKIQKQLALLEKMQSELNLSNTQLKNKLKQAEFETSKLSQELAEHQQQEGKLKLELFNVRNQLASSKLSIAQLKDTFASGQNKIDEEKKELQQLKKQVGSQYLAELNKVKAQLQLRDKELQKHHQLVATLEQEKQRIANEKKALIANQNQTLSEKNSALTRLNNQLSKQNKKLLAQRSLISRLEQEKAQVKQSKAAFEKSTGSDVLAKSQHIQELEEQLALREQKLKQQLAQISELEKNKKHYEQQIKKIQAKKKKQTANAEPSIEILEPPFTITRGHRLPEIKLRSVMSHREITGRVKAPAGLLSLNVNGIAEKITDSGLFKSLIELRSKETLVKTVAIDKAGKKASLEFMLVAADKKAKPVIKKPVEKPKAVDMTAEVDFGPYYALVIGNQKYQHFHDLDTPVNDAKTVEKILRRKYGFKTTLLLNANRYQILSTLNNLRAKLTEMDNLLIYYAGHGELDRVNLRGHWLPVDAEANNTANWISTIAITDILNAMTAKHVMVVADSCYSGAMTRSSLARLEAGMSDKLRLKWLKLMSKTRSRTVLTSGGLKPVLDSGVDGHSIFANAFISAISNNSGILEGQKLYRKVNERLITVTKRLNFKQEPQYAPIRHGGHEAGDFFLIAKH